MRQLRRGDPPTFGQRLVGGFTELYFVDSGRQTRTFAVTLPTADPGIELAGEVDVELIVEDCCEVVRERRGDLAEQLEHWCQERATAVTTQFSVGDQETTGDLTALGRRVVDALQTGSKPELFGMSIRELRIRLRLANQSVVEEEGATALKGMLRAKSLDRVRKIYEPIFGPDFTQIYVALVDRHEDQIPAFLERLQATQQVNQQNRWQMLNSLLNDSSIESHFRDRFARELGKMLLGGDSTHQDLAASLLSRSAEFELTAEASSGDTEHD
jgi:hypothetical protein